MTPERNRRTSRTSVGAGRSSNAWVVTFADLMTLLVCFFVLIISFSIQDKVKMEVVAGSLRNAFGVAEIRRYAGDVKLEGAPDERQPGNIRPTRSPSGEGVAETLAARPAAGAQGRLGGFETAAAERRVYEATKERLETAILTHPILKDAADAITINLTETGLQVLLVDTAGRAMFATGSAEPTETARALLTETGRALAPLANRLIIEGHADKTGAGAYSPFDLTAARANAARRVIEAAGVPADRIAGVTGRGEAAPLYPENPFAPGNRRIEIILEKVAPLTPTDLPF